MEGCDALVHAAASVYAPGSLQDLRAVNVEGTRNVLAAAAMAGVHRTVHVSTVAVYGDVSGPAAEDRGLGFPLAPGDLYAHTKREAEGVAEEFCGQNGLDIIILRPPAILGERDRRIIPRIVQLLRKRLVVLAGTGRNRLAMVYAGNAAAAIGDALAYPGSCEAFNVSEDVEITPRVLFEGLGRELDIRPYFVCVPGGVVRAGARLADVLGFGVPGAPGLSPFRAARLALDDNPYPGDKAKKILGWAPPFSMEEAFARIGKWLRKKDKAHE
jgi:nucleoside-diphosphate-sugar epimerase